MSEVFARVNETARFNYSVKGQIEGVATFEFIGPNGILGQFSYNTKSDYLSIQNGRDVRIDADWNGNIKVTKSHITSSDLGLYTLAKVGRESRDCSFLFILDRPTKPNIISQYTTVGENGTLICNSTSTTYPLNHSLGLIYNWWVNNDTSIKRKFYTYSGNLLIITNLTERDARLEYTCITRENIANGYSSDVSDEFCFNITYGPDENTTLVLPPESFYTLDEGSVLEDISCTGICFPLCYYQWVKKKDNASTVFVNNSGVLSLGVIDRAEAAKYICTVSNPDSMRNVSKEVTVIVRYGPDHDTTILSPNRTSYTLPEDTVLNNISCYCKCNPTCEFIWKRVSDNRTIASGQELSLGHLTRNKADTYGCTVTNPDKNGAVSRDIDISIIYGPDHNTTILTPSASTYIVNEDTILNDINCSGDCLPDCDYQWTKVETIGVEIIGNQTGVLSLGLINRTAASIYTCTVSNPELNRTATKELTIYVRYGPDESATSLSPSTKSYTVDEYSLLSPVTCKSECYPDCVYRWTMIVSGESETVNNTGVLSLGIVERSDAAIYVCTVTNPYMTHRILTRGITVNVKYGPDLPILNVQSPFIITEGDVSDDIICSASCYPACFNIWTNVSNGINIGYAGTFTFGTVTRYQAGVYKCTSHNIDTKNSSQVTIQVVVNYVSIRVSTTNFTEGAGVTLFCEAEGVPSNYTYTYFIQTWEGTEIHNAHAALT
ncbi:hemicentin-1-like [Mercenaria mercenaria]|uniref:hemicentin-1-like n=1 Tax=Mercenaria mercenaria TaxID=6596 RepID=UPI00234FAF09|nr:hemicentin-1-like [Mercenaria mercenaria]